MRKKKRVEKGTLYVNGANLGPAERDPSTGVVEAGPHVAARAKARPKKFELYLGWDGAYVLSKHPLTVHIDNHDGDRLRYLSTGVMHSIADLGPEGRVVFGDLKLKKWEVVKLDIAIKPVPKAKKRKAR